MGSLDTADCPDTLGSVGYRGIRDSPVNLATAGSQELLEEPELMEHLDSVAIVDSLEIRPNNQDTQDSAARVVIQDFVGCLAILVFVGRGRVATPASAVYLDTPVFVVFQDILDTADYQVTAGSAV